MRTDADFFDDAYHRLIAPLHPESDSRREVAALRDILALAQDDVVLDLGCGWGRHLRLLAAAGHRVVGLDLSHALLRRVPPTDTGVVAGGSSALVAGDMRALPFDEGSFDAVLNLATSLGLFLEDRDVVAALSEARRVLRAGGRLLIEGMHRDDVVAGYAERDAWTMEDGTEVRARRRFDALRGVSHEVLRWQGPAGAGSKRHSLRLRTATEMVSLLETAGFEVAGAYGGWPMEPFGHGSERLILVAG
jgi:ubiquinone/menaquinone biosynthesis C-methylase UbiE